jgi:phosphoribosylaminoimidazole carboxylase PurE protein
MKSNKSKVSILMGSKSDMPVIEGAVDILKDFGITCTLNITSAHRSHKRTVKLVEGLENTGTEIFIACAGGAAHLPGVVAALTSLPVIGVPVSSKAFKGLDSLLSIVQMPKGMPVSTVGVNSGGNAALLAVQILSLKDKALRAKYKKFRSSMVSKIIKDDKSVRRI